MLRQDRTILAFTLLFISGLLRAETPVNISTAPVQTSTGPLQNVLKEPQEETDRTKKEKKPIVIEQFSKNLSQNLTWWQMTPENIQIIKNNGGLGFSELVKVILISKKINKPAEEIVKRRNRGESFLKICDRYKLDYTQIKTETKKILSEVSVYGTK